MLLNQNELSLSSFLQPKPNRHLASLSTKLTTANWSPDHTSRAPSPTSSSPPLLHSSLFSLQLHKERLSSLSKYYSDLHQQLQSNLEIAINKLSIKKSKILAKLEFNFQACINEVKVREKEKSFKIINKIKEINTNLKSNEEIIGKLMKSEKVEEGAISEILKYKCSQLLISDNWLEIPVDDLNIGTGGKNKKMKDKVKEVRTGDAEDVEEFDEESQDFMSTLMVEKKNEERYGKGRVRLYVPYGDPPYSCYYYLRLSKGFIVKGLIDILQQRIGGRKEFKVLVKLDVKDVGRVMNPTEKVPMVAVNGWPKLYLKYGLQ